MIDSKWLAGLLGPTLIVVSVSEAMNLRIWTTLAGSNLAPIVYLNGTLLFVAGLAIVRAHNRWTRGWPLLLTLLGWGVLLLGAARMFAPASTRAAEADIGSLFAVLSVLFAVGVFLCFKAFGRADRPGLSEATSFGDERMASAP